jgi:uncharacterized membrane protein YraQ (UPF0718 family)
MKEKKQTQIRKISMDALIYIIITLAIWGAISIVNPSKVVIAGEVAYGAFAKAVKIIIAVFIIIGLIQVWVSTEKLSKILGKQAGLKGLVIASTIPIFIGGSLFTIFPLMKTLKEKGASIAAIMAFVTAWSGKAPLLPLEIEFLGLHFALMRIFLVMPLAVTIGITGDFILGKWQEKTRDKQPNNTNCMV